MSGGGGTQTTQQQTTVQLSPEQKQLLGIALPQLQEFATKPPQSIIPQYSQVAPFTGPQQAGQQMALATAPQQSDILGGAAAASQRILDPGFLDPSNNPALRNIQGTIDANTRSTIDDLLTKALPAIRSGAQLAGPYGGSRQGIAEGQTIGRAAQAVGDIAAKTATPVALTGYTSGLDAQRAALGLAPSTASSLTLPAQTVSGVGDVQQAQQQALLSELYNRDITQNMWPLTLGQQYAGIAGGLPGAGATTVGTAQAPHTNPLLTALGAGAALASFLPIPGAQIAGPLAATALAGLNRPTYG